MKNLKFESLKSTPNFSKSIISPEASKKILGGGNETGGGTGYSCDWEQGCERFRYMNDGTIQVDHCV